MPTGKTDYEEQQEINAQVEQDIQDAHTLAEPPAKSGPMKIEDTFRKLQESLQASFERER